MSFEDFPGKYDVMVGANSRALRLARRAESRRILHNNPGVREAENNQNAIGGWFLNIGNMNNLSTRKDELLHAKMKKQGRQKTNNNAIGGRFLNIGNMNNLSTWKDKLLHAQMKK
jgi:hypothetical protein